MVTSRYCIGCHCVHASTQWYSIGSVDAGRWCNAVYLRLRRIGCCRHPLWLLLLPQLHSIDSSGRPISTLASRVDIQSLGTISSLCSGTGRYRPLWARMFLLGLVFQVYWNEPMVVLFGRLSSAGPEDICRRHLVDAWKFVAAMFRGCRYQQGTLCRSSVGLAPMKNPSERRSGSIRYRAMAKNIRGWQEACRSMSRVVGEGRVVSLGAMLSALRVDGFSVFDDRVCYSNVRMVRALIVSLGLSLADTEGDWAILCRMSPHVRGVCQRWSITWGAAIELRGAIRRELGLPGYSLLDLSCFLCLVDLSVDQ